jgi:ubiquinone biosynthesis protein UbiJ
MISAPSLAAALEHSLNLYLRQDPGSAGRGAALRGKVIALNITGLDLTLYFLPDENGVQVLSHYEGSVDTRLAGSPLGYARLALNRREDALFQGAVRIEGETGTGQAFQDMLADVDWDWEEQLSHLSGDIVAHRIGAFARGAGALLAESRATLAQDSGEYLQEESRLLPTRIEVEYFLAGVDGLREDVDRLQARVDRLLRKTGDAS